MRNDLYKKFMPKYFSYVLGVVVLSGAMLTATARATEPTTLHVRANQHFVNVMGNKMPTLPDFPVLPKKPNKARGYVKDAAGNPLRGAYIGVRASGYGGFYSGASGKTDANGYYEIAIPWGAADFYAASYTVDYGEGRVALSLHPADGATDSFASPHGEVENFVLLNYGIASREYPQHANSYYGGSIYIAYWTCDPCDEYSRQSIPVNGELVVTLTPEGELIDGSRGQTFVIRKAAGPSSLGSLNINNIPVGRYRISARLADGKKLKIQQIRPTEGSPYEMQPRETDESASLLFNPGLNGSSETAGGPNSGNWRMVEISIEAQ